MPATITLLSPAKLNLFLHITGRREDGYHDLQTLFQLLDWGDSLQFHSQQQRRDHAARHAIWTSPPRKTSFIARHGCCNAAIGAPISLCKSAFPRAAGLGGGSSNAATTLLALNHLWQLGLPQHELQALGATLGADVPVFVGGHTAWAEGIGEVLTPVDLPQRWYVIITPPLPRFHQRNIFPLAIDTKHLSHQNGGLF